MTADDPRPADVDQRCNDALHTRGGTLLCSRPAGHFMPHRTASEHTSWSHAGSVECSCRPAASGGATDGERDEVREVYPDLPPRIDDAPVASQADGELAYNGRPIDVSEALVEVAAWLDTADRFIDEAFTRRGQVRPNAGDDVQRDLRRLADWFRMNPACSMSARDFLRRALDGGR